MRRTGQLTAALCVAAVVLALGASAALGATLNVPADYPTIQSAIDAAVDGDTVQVAAGTYYENLTWDYKDIDLIGAGAGSTVVHGGGLDRCLWMEHVPATASIEGFTFTGGSSEQGGGLFLYYSSPTLTANEISGNTATGFPWSPYGGGLYLHTSSPTLTGNSITGNSGGSGTGLYVRDSSPTLTGNTITDNSGTGAGGGVHLTNSSATLTDNDISGNSASVGGGLYLEVGSSATVTGNTIAGNSVQYHGAGVHVRDSSLTVTGNTITGNTAGSLATSTGAGGGLFNYESTLTLTNNTITGNTAGYDGGGMALGGTSVTVANNTISGNTAGYIGGGVDLGTPAATFTNNTITDNSAKYGGGLWLQGPDPWSPTLTNNTIASNVGGGLHHYWGGLGTPVITNCILWGNVPAEGYSQGDDLGWASATYSDIGTGDATGIGNISADPLFVDPDTGDYRLQSGSPCIDAGDDSAPDLPLTDKDGEPRILGEHVDMGAYEWLGIVQVAIDIKPGSDPNAINNDGHGVIPVAVLGSADLEVSLISVETVTLEGMSIKVVGKADRLLYHYEDVNADGFDDLVVQIQDADGAFEEGAVTATLTGELLDATPIVGYDDIIVVP